MREMKIQIPENDYQILTKSLRSTLRIRPSQTEKIIPAHTVTRTKTSPVKIVFNE